MAPVPDDLDDVITAAGPENIDATLTITAWREGTGLLLGGKFYQTRPKSAEFDRLVREIRAIPVPTPVPFTGSLPAYQPAWGGQLWAAGAGAGAAPSPANGAKMPRGAWCRPRSAARCCGIPGRIEPGRGRWVQVSPKD